MADYLAQRIIDEALAYTNVIAKKPTLKIEIDKYLTSKGRQDLIIN